MGRAPRLTAAPCRPLALQDVPIDKPQVGSLGTTTTLVVTHAKLFTPGTLVTITNTLGTCMLPCESERAARGGGGGGQGAG